MSDDRHNRVREVFLAAMRTSGEARAAFLDEACAGDEELRREVESLLRFEGETGDFLATPAARVSSERDDLLGTTIGSYRLLERIGEGGFGIVYLAEQREPIRRRVALKVLKPGMDSASVVARFEVERRALALMDHPNIARVLDAGVTDASLGSRPYFIMEYVQGVPITEYCDRHRLGISDRLGLFTTVCEAVHHAHQKGIIHRDLKPSNVLVSAHASQAVPKVIDFGVAKALNRPLTEQTLFTLHGQLIGTPEYMSPEQAEMTMEEIDARSDIYSLGVLLYELLTGTLPFEPTTLRSAAIGEIQRIIREVEPAKPSTRVVTMASKATPDAQRAAQARHTEPRNWSRVVRGDLDWITMRCLAKEPRRRYESASALAKDVGRYMRHEPVEAGPPSAAYKARKFVRRHRVVVAAAGAAVAALVVGLGIATWQWRVAESERSRAEMRFAQVRALANTMLNEYDRSIRALPGSTEPRRLLVTESLAYLRSLASEAPETPGLGEEVALGFLRVGDILGGARTPNLGDAQGALASYREGLAVIDRVRNRADSAGARRMAALLHLRLGDFHRAAGDADLAAESFERSIDLVRTMAAEDVDTSVMRLLAAGLLDLGRLLAGQCELAEATRFIERSVEVRERLARTEPSASVMRSLSVGELALGEHLIRIGRASDGLAMMERALATRRGMLDENPESARAIRDVAIGELVLAESALRAGRADRASDLLASATQRLSYLAEEDPDDARVRDNLVRVYLLAGEVALKRARPGEAQGAAEQAGELIEWLKRNAPSDAVDRFRATMLMVEGGAAWARGNAEKMRSLFDDAAAALGAPSRDEDEDLTRLRIRVHVRAAAAGESAPGWAAGHLGRAEAAMDELRRRGLACDALLPEEASRIGELRERVGAAG